MKIRAVAFPLIAVIVLSFVGCSERESSSDTLAEQSAPVPSSTTAPAAPAATATSTTPPAAPAAAGPIATAEGEQSGVRAEVTELDRTSGGTVNLKFTMINDSDDTLSFGYDFGEKNEYGDISGIHLIDQAGKKKYFVARDAEGACVCSRGLKDMQKGERRNLWAKFPAPPAEVKTISVVIPKFSPLDDVPISE